MHEQASSRITCNLETSCRMWDEHKNVRVIVYVIGACDSSLEKLSWGLNRADGLPTLLTSGMLPNLAYINLRKSLITAAVLCEMAPCMKMENLTTLVLDGIKLAGSTVLAELFGKYRFYFTYLQL